MEAENKIEARTARMILDRGVKYTLGEESITIRPLRFGTVLTICEKVCDADLTVQKVKEGEKDVIRFFKEYANLMLECVAVAELNDKKKLNDKNIESRADFYKDNLNAFQLYELFVHVLNLSGIEPFTVTIGLLLSMKEANLSPRTEGS
jgi:hypothetical protein